MKWQLNQIAAAPVTTLANTFLKPRRRWLIGLALALLCAGLIAAWMVKRNAQREFDAARTWLERQSFVPFEKEARPALPGSEIKLIQSSRHTRSLARFNDSIFAATDGGLVEFAEDGKLNCMVGADPQTLAEVKPVLEKFCENIFHVGGPGSGHKVKLVYNFVAMAHAAICCESLAACARVGISLESFFQLVSAGGAIAGSRQLRPSQLSGRQTTRLTAAKISRVPRQP